MSNQTQPYIGYKPGDLIAAESMNEMQVKIKEDIQGQIKVAKEEVKKTGVDRADNAGKFDNKTPKVWTDELDQRYATKVHDHEGLAAYRRYFKRLRPGQTVVLEHKLGRFPLVDVSELLPIAPGVTPPINEKFYLYYHHEERDRDLLFTEDRGMVRWPWGTPLEQLLSEYQVEWEDDDSLGDVVNDFLDAFFKPPAVDHIEHKTSKWIDDHREMTIGKLKERNEWPDIRWVVRPEKLVVGHVHIFGVPETGFHLLNVHHLSYDTLAVIYRQPPTGISPPPQPIDLMILLRS
jgi:hypothetical protein